MRGRRHSRSTPVRKPDRQFGLASNPDVRHFDVAPHMMEKASTIWASGTGIDRNPAGLIEVRRANDSSERCLSEDELAPIRQTSRKRESRSGYFSDVRTGRRIHRGSNHSSRSSETKLFDIEFSDLHLSEENSVELW